MLTDLFISLSCECWVERDYSNRNKVILMRDLSVPCFTHYPTEKMIPKEPEFLLESHPRKNKRVGSCCQP